MVEFDNQISVQARDSYCNEVEEVRIREYHLESERIYLRLLNRQDINDEFIAWFSDDSLMQYFTNTQTKITREKIINTFMNSVTKSYDCWLFGIFYKENNKLIGTIKVGIINRVHNISDLVVLLGNKKYHGQGLAVEAIKLGNKLATDFFKIRKLFGGMYESNIASIKAYTKAGWKVEGILKDYYQVNGRLEKKVLVSYEKNILRH